MITRRRANRAGVQMVKISQELIAILAVGVVVIGSYWRLDDDIDDLRERIVRLEEANNAGITGTVTAPNGVLSSVMVVASGPPRRIPGTESVFTDNKGTHTDIEGRYVFDGLRPGIYTLRAFMSPASPGREEVEVSAGSRAIVNIDINPDL